MSNFAYKEALTKAAIAELEGQNWTDQPFTDREKTLIEMTVDFMVARFAIKTGHDVSLQEQALAMRPANYDSLSPRERWDIDKRLGILDAE